MSGELAGMFDRVDLDPLVTEQFPHQLSGLAVVRLQRATVESGKLTELRGTLQRRIGAISPSLLAAAAEHLQLAAPANLAAMDPSRAVPFRHLALGFHLSGRTLQLTGSADATQAGALLANAGGPLLAAPPRHATAAVNLLRTLLPDNQYQVPATRQSDALIGLLPVPDLAPARTAAVPGGHTPTRLGPGDPNSGPAIRQPGLR